jgi:hypothetical protein
MTTILILVVCWVAVLVFALALCKIAALADRDSEQIEATWLDSSSTTY